MLDKFLATILLASGAFAIQKADVGIVDWHQALIGVPTQPFTIHNELAIAPTDAGVIAALHISNGSVAWRHVLPPNEHLAGYDINTISQEIAVLSGPGGATLHVLSAQTGMLLQETQLHKIEQGVLTEPVSAASDVVLLPDGSTFTLTDGVRVTRRSASGEIEWTYPASTSQKPISKFLTKLVLPSDTSAHLYAVVLEKSSSHTSLSLLDFTTASGELTTVSIPTSHVHVGQSPQMIVLDRKSLVWLEEGLGSIKHLTLPPTGLEKAKPLSFRLDKAYDSIESIGGGMLAGFTTNGIARSFLLDTASNKLAPAFSKPPNAIACASTLQGDEVVLNSCIADSDAPKLILPTGEEWELPVFGEIRSYTLIPGEVPSTLVTTTQGTIGFMIGSDLEWERLEGFSQAEPFFLQLPEPPSSIAATSHDGENFINRLIRHFTVQLPQFVRSLTENSNVEVTEGLYKDPFSFRQIILRTTKNGWISALDGEDGTVIWTRELTPEMGKRLTHEKWFTMEEDVVLLAVNPWKETILYRLNGLTGDVKYQEVFSAKPYIAAHVLTLPSTNTETLMVVVDDLTISFLPTRPTDPVDLEYMAKITIPVSRENVVGFKPSAVDGGPLWKLEPTWTSSLPGRVLEFNPITPNAGDNSAAPAASFGKVIHQKDGTKNVLYKYLNSRLFWSVTSEPAGLYLIDGVKGTVVYSVALPTGDVRVELVENWLVYAYLADDGDSKAWTIVSVELYEGEEDALTSSPDASAYVWGPVGNITTFERSFLLPHWAGGVTAMKVSTTKRGVAGRDLLVSTTSSHLLALPYKMLNPRRPPQGQKPTAEQIEEGLIPYEPVLLGDGKSGGSKRVISHAYKLESLARIVTKPTLLESTSIVFGYGELDMFMGRVAPSGTFDRLSEGFNKPQLILTIVALTIGIVVVKPIVKRKQLRERWYH